MKRIMLGMAAAFVLAVAGIAASAVQSESASAAPAPPQCNGEMNVGGQEVACTVVIDNYIAAGGGLASSPPSTLTMTRCVGAAGPLSTLTCETTVTTLSAPVTSIAQCNGSGSGGGGSVICSVHIANHFEGAVTGLTPATIYQCVDSIITGPGAPGSCTPANTAGVTSVSQATVGQCNGSGNGGTNVGFICSVSSNSTMSSALPVNIDQCNGSGNGGGALVRCEAYVTNDAFGASPTATTPASTPTAVGSTPTTEATASPTSTPINTPSPENTPVTPDLTTTPPPATGTPNTTPQAQFPPSTPTVATPPATSTTPPNTTPQAQVPPSTPASSTPQANVPPASTPLPPSTGDSIGKTDGMPSWSMVTGLGILLATLGLGGLALSRRSTLTN